MPKRSFEAPQGSLWAPKGSFGNPGGASKWVLSIGVGHSGLILELPGWTLGSHFGVVLVSFWTPFFVDFRIKLFNVFFCTF